MAIRISASVIDTLLLGPASRRRQLQNFPVLADVWTLFADQPGQSHDLLLTPKFEHKAATIAKFLAEGAKDSPAPKVSRRVSYLQDLAVARFFLDDLIWTGIPATDWWRQVQEHWEENRPDTPVSRLISHQLDGCLQDERLGENIGAEHQPSGDIRAVERLLTLTRQAVKLGLVFGVLKVAADLDTKATDTPKEPLDTLEKVSKALNKNKIVETGSEALETIFRRGTEIRERKPEWFSSVWLIALNRRAMPAVERSVNSVKADAARLLFSIKTDKIGWAVLDSGIDREHPAFFDHAEIDRLDAAKTPPGRGDEPTRIKATYDFGQIRNILSFDHLTETPEPSDLAMELARTIKQPSKTGGDKEVRLLKEARRIQRLLHKAAEDMDCERPTDWEKLRGLIERRNPDRPDNPHGTHVAGVLGADWREETDRTKVKMAGVCPDITLYDFRVLGATAEESEYAIIGALQFIRHLNSQSGYRLIAGVNMSLSIAHSVRNYACGWTPVCVESEAVVSSGVVVVAAAGNHGFQKYQLADNRHFESYASSSITDPGNAENVITVGATHRYWPHTYGVSFFSSRGPTGDGRPKPDILAPGEKITSCVPNEGEDEMDGTSMAAPHVSGAAALLMARNEELKGQPARIKQILCNSATDLNRDRTFQGHGMLDVLRALQSI